MQLAQKLVASEGAPPATYPIALTLLLLMRDSVGTAADWTIVLDFVRSLPRKFADEPAIQENRAFAAAQAGNDIQAIAELETLIEMAGPTPERLGLMGGRYKRLAKAAISDEWLRPTLLAAAFDLGDAGKAEELAHDVVAEGQATWKVHSVLGDLEASVLQVSDAAKRARLSSVIDRIKTA
jgi:Tetratricopeptide Repeats-Sensor